jgi:hypothetical protein
MTLCTQPTIDIRALPDGRHYARCGTCSWISCVSDHMPLVETWADKHRAGGRP